jgi:hypothetical protein
VWGRTGYLLRGCAEGDVRALSPFSISLPVVLSSRTDPFAVMVRSSTLVLALVASAVAAPAPAARACAWPSWKGVRHMFVLCVYGFCLCAWKRDGRFCCGLLVAALIVAVEIRTRRPASM